MIPVEVAFFEIYYMLTWVTGTIEAIGQTFVFDTIFYLAFAAMFRLFIIAVQAPGTWFFIFAMPIANLAIHSTRGEHDRINIL